MLLKCTRGSSRTVCTAQSGVVRHAATVGSVFISRTGGSVEADKISVMERLRVHKPFSLYIIPVLFLGSTVSRCEGNAESISKNKHESELDLAYSY
jgi:hypothetical protein